MSGAPLRPAADLARLWLDWALLSIEASQVIALRLMLLSGGGRRAERESERMVEEKLGALMQVGWRLAWGQWGPLPQAQAQEATRLYRRKVRANLRRLG
jgi:hypothetical protein